MDINSCKFAFFKALDPKYSFGHLKFNFYNIIKKKKIIDGIQLCKQLRSRASSTIQDQRSTEESQTSKIIISVLFKSKTLTKLHKFCYIIKRSNNKKSDNNVIKTI